MICRCGEHLNNNIIPCNFLHLLLSDEEVKQCVLSLAKRSLLPRATKRHLAKHKNRATQQLPPALHSAATIVFSCFNCERLHIFWQQDGPAVSYRTRLEKPFDEVSDTLGLTPHRLLADTDYDAVVEGLVDPDNPAAEFNLSAFQERFLHSSKPIWFTENFQQVFIEWKDGWTTRYSHEYGKMPLP